MNNVHNTSQRVLQIIEQSGLLTRRAAERLLLPSVRIHVGNALDHDTFPLGGSRIGGCPDLPPGMDWPRVEVPQAMRDEPTLVRRLVGNAPGASLGDDRALPFLCQISLSEVSPLDLQRVLPEQGMLLFFYDITLDFWIEMYGGNPPVKRDPRAWRVVYVENPSHLQRATPPDELSPEQQFAPCPVSFHLEWMLPSVESPLLDGLSRPMKRYLKLLEKIAEEQEQAHDPQGCLHRLLGYDQPIQADVSRYLSAVSGETRESGLGVWRLLLQLDSDANAGMQWVDAGSLYLCLRQPDLDVRRFDAARGVLQFH